MNRDDGPLFRWEPTCRVIAFPPERRVGKVRDVAQKWLNQGTDKQAAGYVHKIDTDMHRQYLRLGFSPGERKRLVACFWREVELEIGRIQRISRPGDGAA